MKRLSTAINGYQRLPTATNGSIYWVLLITIDSNDNIYITGSVDGTIDGQLYTCDKQGDMFLMKYKELPSQLLSSSSFELSDICTAT